MSRVGWLKPGLGVKRWLLLAFLGAGTIALGALSGIRALATGAQLPDPLVQIAEAVALRDLDPMVRAAVAAGFGLLLVGVGGGGAGTGGDPAVPHRSTGGLPP